MRVTPAMADWMVSSSHTLPLTVLLGRFLATLEMTMRGKTLRRGGVFA